MSERHRIATSRQLAEMAIDASKRPGTWASIIYMWPIRRMARTELPKRKAKR